jgi:aminoglycoside phosphotransferase family enzyme/predicted kinase
MRTPVARAAGGELPQSLAGLLGPRAYPHPVDVVSLLQTPISWVLLAGAFAYKIKRPVQYPFLDQRSLERRRWLCEEELRLNRRFAPDLYLEVCRIVAQDGGVVMRTATAGGGRVLEHAVRMLRFDSADRLDRLLADGRIEPATLEDFGRRLADIHAALPVVTDDAPWGRPGNISELLLRNLQECAEASTVFNARESVAALRKPLARRVLQAWPWMAIRRTTGRVRECHADLHSRNIARRGDRLLAFDCLEYEPAFRWIDVADEIAFLSSDLGARRFGAYAHAFRGAYLERSGDYHACRVLKMYEAHRALVRAKVAALAAAAAVGAAREPLREEHEQLVAHAARVMSGAQPRLVLMSGLSGSGKTWLARRIAERLEAVHLRSDIERKRRAGLGTLESSGCALAEGMYSSEASALVHEDMARAAGDALAGGFTVIVDATLLRREERRRFIELGAHLGIRPYVVRCQAPLPVLRARLQARAAAGLDPSEADASVLEWQRRRAEPVGADEPLDSMVVDADDPCVIDNVLEHIQACGRGGFQNRPF